MIGKEMNDFLLSVIILCRNMNMYLKECVDSILMQQYSNIEIILTCDDSQDPVCEIMRDYYSRYPNIIMLNIEDSEKLAGGARNRALKLAHGDIITFVDGDDWISAGMYIKMIPYFEDFEIDMVLCDYNEWFEDTKEVVKRSMDSSLSEGIYQPIEAGRLFFTESYAWNSFFRRELIRRMGLQFFEGVLYEDLIVHAFFAASKKIAYVPIPFCQHRKHKSEITAMATANQHCTIINTTYELVNVFRNNIDYKKWKEKINELVKGYLFNYVYYLMRRGSLPINEDILIKCARTYIDCCEIIGCDYLSEKRVWLQLETPSVIADELVKSINS